MPLVDSEFGRVRARVGVLAGSLTTGVLVQSPTAERVCRNPAIGIAARERA